VRVAVSVAEVDAATIDRINIYQATRMAMRWLWSRLTLCRIICWWMHAD